MPDVKTDALTSIISALEPLNSEDRHRTVEAAMTFLGETVKTPADRKHGAPTGRGGPGVGDGTYSEAANRWMEQNNVSIEELEQVFHIETDGGTFEIHDVPGKSKKDKTLNTYILTGLGQFLATNAKAFEDALARQFCVEIGCYDRANHATHINKYKGSELSGNISKGFTITGTGLKRGAALVKEFVGAAK